MCHHRRTRLWGSSGNGFRPQAALADLKDLHPSLPLPTRKLLDMSDIKRGENFIFLSYMDSGMTLLYGDHQ